MSSYAFSFDASACTGCKACQVACKDKNNLPVGVLWRRVMEVSGGEWLQTGKTWSNTVFAYNLSMACNHCLHPKCAGVCPTNAYHVRPDGIVLLDSSKCVGCGYCNWACPYAVPQYNPAAGVMSKCNFCYDALDAGQPPACVAACPLRVLDFLQVDEDAGDPAGLPLWQLPGAEHPFPLPSFSRTQPHLLIRPHDGMLNPLYKQLANREEIKPAQPKSELPLVFFSLLAQMAVGGFWASQWLFPPFLSLVQSDIFFLRLLSQALVGICLGLGALVSFAHLGQKRNAWRVIANYRKSWLSREILALGLFGAGWLLSVIFPMPVLGALTSLMGLGLVYSMANIYQLRSMAVWNSWRTLAGFLVSASLLGLAGMAPVWRLTAEAGGVMLPPAQLAWVYGLELALLVGELGLQFAGWKPRGQADWLRTGLLGMGMLALLELLLIGRAGGPWFDLSFLVVVWAEEILGRWRFYHELEGRRL